MPQLGQLATRSWWAQVAESAVRQNLQILAPFLALVAGSGAFDSTAALATLVAFVVACVSVVLFRVARVTPPDGSPVWLQAGYRAISAFAASCGAAFTASGFDLLNTSPGPVLTAAFAAAGLALIHWKADPPASKVLAGEVLASRDARPLGDPPVRMEFNVQPRDDRAIYDAVQRELRRRGGRSI